jgi:hypothetical protein
LNRDLAKLVVVAEPDEDGFGTIDEVDGVGVETELVELLWRKRAGDAVEGSADVDFGTVEAKLGASLLLGLVDEFAEHEVVVLAELEEEVLHVRKRR